MLQSVPPQRLLLYFIVAGLVPLAIAWFFLSNGLNSTHELSHQIKYIQEQAFSREQKQANNVAIRNHFRNADHFYIDKHLEILTLLEPEIDSLNSMIDNPNFPVDEHVRKRLEFLNGNGNTIRFVEGSVQSTPLFQEVTETLAHPVEVNISDLQQILCRIEGVPIGTCTPPAERPQLLILDFKINKKNVSEKNQVFLLNLKLLKREFK